MHTGIDAPLEEDAVTESRAAASGGVTSSLNYFRTGQYYLNKGGPYAKVFPEVLRISKGRFHVDYGYHLAPMDSTHIREIPQLADRHGVASFRFFMFHGSHGLHGASDNQRDFLMIGPDDRYDYAHFEFVMRAVEDARRRDPRKASQISLSLHCETAEIMTAYTKMVEREGRLKGLAAYHAARPPHSEGLAVFIAAYLADETRLANINLLHLSSRKALTAALQMAALFPHIDFRREVTIGHLMLDVTSRAGALAKVNPPIRPREDVEFLWDKLAEGSRRGLGYNHVARLTSFNPARRFGLNRKGDIDVGLDADIALVDPAKTWTVRARGSESSQGHTPFEGIELAARVDATFLRGALICEDGRVLGKPRGEYLFRPTD